MKPPTFDYSDTTFTLACPPSNTSPQVVHLHLRPPLHLEVNHPAKADQASHNPTMNGLFRYGHSLNRAKAGSLYHLYPFLIPTSHSFVGTTTIVQEIYGQKFVRDIEKSLCQAFRAYPFYFYVNISLFVGTLHPPKNISFLIL